MNCFFRLMVTTMALTGVGAVHAQRTYGTAPRSASTSDYLNYMSGRCRTLNETLHNAYARRLSRETQHSLQQEYQDHCADEEYEARSQSDAKRRDQRQQLQDASRQRELAREQSTAHTEQCRESQRIIATKRARTDLTEGEKSDLNRFEANVRSRCS